MHSSPLSPQLREAIRQRMAQHTCGPVPGSLGALVRAKLEASAAAEEAGSPLPPGEFGKALAAAFARGAQS